MHDKTQGPTAHHRQAHDMLIDSPLLLKGGRGKATHKKNISKKAECEAIGTREDATDISALFFHKIVLIVVIVANVFTSLLSTSVCGRRAVLFPPQ